MSDPSFVSEDELPSLIQPFAGAYSASTCGYCSDQPGIRSVAKSSVSYGFVAHQLSPRIYQLLIDRGWRRSGTYIYKPDMRATCCPQYPIRCVVNDFRASKSQRQLINRLVRRLKAGEAPKSSHSEDVPAESCPVDLGPDIPLKAPVSRRNMLATRKSLARTDKDVFQISDLCDARGRNNVIYRLMDKFTEAEAPDMAHPLVIRTEPASFTTEKYELFKLYQEQVHNDSGVSERGFRQFLCDTPLVQQRANSSTSFGSFHQMYYIDKTLIGIGVIDILPRCISSVYFVWHPLYKHLSLGKVGALREIALAQQLSRNLPNLQYYYLGYYIHTCAKMRYKADYRPSELADLATYTWHAYDACRQLLESDSRAFFDPDSRKLYGSGNSRGNRVASDMSEEADARPFPDPAPPGWLQPMLLAPKDLNMQPIWVDDHLAMFGQTKLHRRPQVMQVLRECTAALGSELAHQMLFVFE